MKRKSSLSLFRPLTLFILLSLLSAAALADPKVILMVLTSHDQLGNTGKSTGFYLTEVTHPYKIFVDAGYRVEFASPRGGHPPIDGLHSADTESLKLLWNRSFRKALSQSKSPGTLEAKNYAAVFYAGGHGTMWDLPNNVGLQKLTSEIYDGGGTVAAVCHGPVGLVNVRLSNGKYLVDGQPVAAFTNDEEEAAGLTNVMPFLLESKLRERGANIQNGANFQANVAVGERLVTGQNPSSAKGVAEALVRVLQGK